MAIEDYIKEKKEKDYKRGFSDWNEEYGKQLKVGDEVLFVYDSSSALGWDEKFFKQNMTSLVKIIDIKRGRIYIDGSLNGSSGYSKSFYVKSGKNCKHPKGYGSLKIKEPTYDEI